MLALDDYIASLAPSLLVLGLALAVLPFLRREDPLTRAVVLALPVLLAWRYMAWRFAETVPPLDWTLDAAAGWSFALLEAGTLVSSTIAFAIMTRTRDRREEADRHQEWWRPGAPPVVDVLIATYNEEEPILERTIAGALALNHPRTRVWILDDGKRDWLRELCARTGARYLTRNDNAHAKAGNINSAFAVLRGLDEPPDFVAVLDADFVPHRNFLDRTLTLFHDERVGLVQTPQHFFNPDPIQHNLGLERAYPDEQRFFFDHVQPARDAWDIAFCCGTSSVMRWKALEAIGGFPVGSVTEDYLITLRLREEGYSTAYLNEALTEGLAPEGLGEYITQRGRWCLGLMQIIRGPMGPFAKNRLRLRDRIGLFDSFLYWATTYPFRLACLVTPLLYWYFGITVVDAPVAEVLSYFVPYLLAALIALNWTSRGMVVPLLNDVSQVLGAREISGAVMAGLLKPKGHKFKVTAKGGDRNRVVVQWPVLRPLLVLFMLTFFGLMFMPVTDIVFDRDAGDGKWVILVWTLYNLLVLAASMAVCVELPRGGKGTRIVPERVRLFADSGASGGWLMRLTLEEAWITGAPALPPGERCALDLPGAGHIAGVVARHDPGGVSLRLEPTAEQRAAILTRLHTREGASGVTRTDVGGMVRGLAGRVVRN
ncbi:glycosyltransferase [Sabulicella rubraurantiaca]|uniref:glycosyltransferase n=1 Tax=Sabulicella rubraurantiaca TaxID=2811429 RepID=UPI001A9726C2|nr:cellulose synthase catalytic subunit [Sabulicella rubraurantiaca]